MTHAEALTYLDERTYKTNVLPNVPYVPMVRHEACVYFKYL